MIRQVQTTRDFYQYAMDDNRVSIFIGRNARANDDLVRIAQDTPCRSFWMHLMDHSSSHGIVTVHNASHADVVQACKFVKEWLLSIVKTKGLNDDVLLCDIRYVKTTKTRGQVRCDKQVLMSDPSWTQHVT